MKPRYSPPFRVFEVRDPRTGKRKQFSDEEAARDHAEDVARETGCKPRDLLRESRYFYSWRTDPGKRGTERESTRCRGLVAARDWVQERNGEGRIVSKKNRILLGAAIEEWLSWLEMRGRAEKTIHDYKIQAKYWTETLGDKPVPTIGPDDLEKFFEKRKGGPRLKNLNLVLWRSFSKWCRTPPRAYMDRDPTAGLDRWKEPRNEPRVLSVAEVGSLLIACQREYKVGDITGKRNIGGVEGGVTRDATEDWSQTFRPPPGLYPAVALALTSLLRLGNVLGLRWGDLDLGRDEIRIPAERVKTRQEMVIPLAPVAKRAIMELPKGGPEALVFGVGELKHPFHSAVTRAKLQGVTFHCLRKTGATFLRECGVALETVMKLGGWSTGGNVLLKHYRAVGMEELRAAVGLLDKLVTKATATAPASPGTEKASQAS